MAIVSKKVFREYDIRGLVGPDITTELAYFIGRAFGAEVRQNQGQKICVGRDGRLSSPELTEKLVEGLLDSGLEVICLEVGPTPMTYFAAHSLSMDAAIMVTGSHNPGDQNGFKMVLKGKSFWGESVQKIRQRIEAEDFSWHEKPSCDEKSKSPYLNLTAPLEFEKPLGTKNAQQYSIMKTYITYLVESYLTYYGEQRPLRVAWDPGNGAAGEVVSEIVQRLPGKHFLINEKIDGTFPAHHPDPTVAENLQQLQKTVLEHQCDIGFAFDGDGDRLGVVDGDGTILWGDEFLVLLAKEVLDALPGAMIIADVKASQSFFEAVTQMGGQPLMWKTGHSLIKTKMQETKAPLAGEMSGHVFYADRYFGFDDGVYAALRLMGVCASGQTSLAEWNRQRPTRINTPEIRLACESQNKIEIVQHVIKTLQKRKTSIDLTDGVRVTSDQGWWLLRASNTQDVLVVRAESTSHEGLANLIDEMQSHLSPFGLMVTPYPGGM